MKLQQNSQNEFFLIGTSQQAVAEPSNLSKGSVQYVQFGVGQSKPLTSGVPILDYVKALEADPEMAALLTEARKDSVKHLHIAADSLRGLRLSMGLSQSTLADMAATTQAHVANIEAGKKDPSTDMIVRLSSALKVPPELVFNAVRRQLEK